MIRISHRRIVVRVWAWFEPRWRDIGAWAFIANRISAVGLTLYLFMHLVVLSTRGTSPFPLAAPIGGSLLILGWLLLALSAFVGRAGTDPSTH